MTVAEIVYVLMALACLFGLVRLALPAHQRRQLDQYIAKKWALTLSFFRGMWQRKPATQKVSASVQAARAQQEAAAAIEQARRTARATEVSRDGNVYTPEAFKGPRKRP